MEEPDYEALLRSVVEGRRVILAGGPVAGFTPTAELMRRLGAEAVLVVGTEGTGSGPLPAADVAEWVAADAPPVTSMLDAIRAGIERVRVPPPQLRDAIERFDPTGSALAIGTFLNESPELLGRPFLAHRRPEWVALDDKTTVDALWDDAGVAHAPSAVVPLDPHAVRRAATRLDAGAGTVWAADATRGWHGGADGLRWVRRADELDEAVAAFAGRSERVRVMPFLEGVPCGIHGVVFADHVLALRPVEQITLRRVGQPTFFYAGCATFYDPPAAVADDMRAVARRVGARLRARFDYRGAFTIDGVVGADGFLPTELNPRSGAGLNVIQHGQPTVPVQLLLDAVVGGRDLPYDPRQLEQTLRAGADAHRGGGTWRLVPASVIEVESRGVTGGPDGWRWSSDGAAATGEVTAGPSSFGGFVRLRADPHRTPTGPPFAPAAAAFWAFADRELGTGVGLLEAATVPVGRD